MSWKPIAALFGLLALCACNANGTLTPQAQADIAKACQVDAVAQPIAVAVAPLAGPAGAVGAAVDVAAVHPEVVAGCAAAAANQAPAAVGTVGAVTVPVTVDGQAVSVTVTPVAPAAK